MNALHEVKACIDSLGGDTRLWNDALYENYLSVSHYFDDRFEKTAFFMDTLSNAVMLDDFAGRTQNFGMRWLAWIPSAAFKIFCASESKKPFIFPKLFRTMWAERRANEEIMH